MQRFMHRESSSLNQRTFYGPVSFKAHVLTIFLTRLSSLQEDNAAYHAAGEGPSLFQGPYFFIR